jgi:hypothetical protein
MAFGKTDTINGEILPDGRIKSETEAISAANHHTAEQFFAYLATLMGTEQTRTRRKQGHSHVHSHGEKHEHSHS